jgi:type II secretory pathway pseudopilin PulG
VPADALQFRVFRLQLRPRNAIGADVRRQAAFTLVEVMVAASVMVLGIAASLLTLQRGFQALDTARHTTYASQVMQSELERLRLKSWSQMQTLQDSGDTAVPVGNLEGTSGSFRCNRVIRDLKEDMKEILLVSSWTGYDGRPHTLRYLTRYSRTGLYDYFYTAH